MTTTTKKKLKKFRVELEFSTTLTYVLKAEDDQGARDQAAAASVAYRAGDRRQACKAETSDGEITGVTEITGTKVRGGGGR